MPLIKKYNSIDKKVISVDYFINKKLIKKSTSIDEKINGY